MKKRNYKVVSEVVLNDGTVIPVVGGNVYYFGRQNQAINYASRRNDIFKAKNVNRNDRIKAFAVYENANGNFNTMKYRCW